MKNLSTQNYRGICEELFNGLILPLVDSHGIFFAEKNLEYWVNKNIHSIWGFMEGRVEGTLTQY